METMILDSGEYRNEHYCSISWRDVSVDWLKYLDIAVDGQVNFTDVWSWSTQGCPQGLIENNRNCKMNLKVWERILPEN